MSSSLSALSALLGLSLLLAGCASEPSYSPASARSSSTITPYPDSRLPAQAPPSSKVRCASLPPLGNAAGSSTRQLLLEIQRARSAYTDCANRHNVLIDFTQKLEQGLLDMRNDYQRQLVP